MYVYSAVCIHTNTIELTYCAYTAPTIDEEVLSFAKDPQLRGRLHYVTKPCHIRHMAV